jgi:hypothetical protein
LNTVPAIPGTSPILEGSAKVNELGRKKEEKGVFFERHLCNQLKINKIFEQKN